MAERSSLTYSVDDQLSTMFNDIFLTEMNVENQELFTSYPNSPSQTRLTVTTDTSSSSTATTTKTAVTTSSSSSSSSNKDSDSETSTTIHEEYHIRTLHTHNAARLSILPIFPPLSSSTTPHLLLANVPIEQLTTEQYARIRSNTFPKLFKLEMITGDILSSNPKNCQPCSCESFLSFFYHNLYMKIKKRLKVDIPIIDFNFIRLLNCVSKVVVQYNQQQTSLNLDELSLALEFYLQFDVDMFYLKTCSFNGVQPRIFHRNFREGLFCIDTPRSRFVITPCNNKYCLCCHTPCPRQYVTDSQQITIIPFSIPHIHRFVNQYEAILNCPATCKTKHCIYVLTCPCGQFDFVGHSKISFTETLKNHREESNRIIREFLIGEINVQYITHGLKSDEKKANDKRWLYQHTPRCSIALQLFLDYNMDYWCFVPMKLTELNMANNTIVQGSIFRQINNERTTTSSSVLSTSWTRTDEEIHILVNNIPKPPFGFHFSIHQRQQQIEFFKWFKDRNVPLDNVDVYNADIVAVLHEKSSELFGQLIQSLFITHAECKLNEIGHLVYENSDPNRTLHNSWCTNLTRHPFAS